MAALKPGDRVSATSTWNGKRQGRGTVVTVNDKGAGVELDKAKGSTAHFYNSELTKVTDRN
jgi:hypothetical protein